MVRPRRPVTLILNKSYGLRAIDDARTGAVWLVRSPENEAAAVELRHKSVGRTEDVSVFDPVYEDIEQACLLVVPAVDLHHPEMSELFVVGVCLTPRLQAVFGDRVIRETDLGFVLAPSDDPYGRYSS